MKINYSKLISFLLFILSLNVAQAQFKLPSGYAESEVTASAGKELPFWIISNNYGIYSSYKNNVMIRGNLATTLDNNKNFDYAYGLDAFGRYDNKGNFTLHQAYLQGKIYIFTFQAGKKEEQFGNQDSTLSCGGFAWSRNAPPLPSVGIYVTNYTNVPFTFGYLQFKGALTHSWFGNQYLSKNAYLHHKYVGLKAGGSLPFHINFEFHHYAQWGGDIYYFGHQPSNLKAFYDVFFAKETQIDTFLGQFLPNTLGNHLGTRNLGIDYQFQNFSVKAYWQDYFEDADGFHWRGIRDGLWGIVVKNNNPSVVSKFLYEFLHTTNQSGPTFTYISPDGNSGVHLPEDYFNHWFYRFGWTYNNYTIGTPLITSPIITGNQMVDNIINNRIIAHHFGIEGVIHKANYKILYTYSLNYGTYEYSFDTVKSQHSFLFDGYYQNVTALHLDLGVIVGIDKGSLYGNNLAISLHVKKQFSL